MNRKPKAAALLSLTFAALSSIASLSALASAEMIPKGWIKAGSFPQLYDVDLLKNTDGRSAVFLHSTGERPGELTQPNVFGTLMQVIASDAYAGKRLRLSATVKAENVLGWAGLWMRVDGARGKTLSFDNMEKRPMKGSADPKKYSVVLDVPRNAQSVSYGVLLTGAGAVSMWEVRVETVGKDVPVTSGAEMEPLPAKPQNLDFSE